MSPESIFNEYLVWNGIIGYSEKIIAAHDGIRESNV
jgi:hypothetical protein